MARSVDALRRALGLVRYLRAMAITEGIDPRDLHVALGFAYVIDELEAGDTLGPQEHLELHAESWRLIRDAVARGP